MKRKYFGTDGVRGKVGEYPMTAEFAMRLAFAAGTVLVNNETNGKRRAVLIGKDTRISGYTLEAAMEAGFASAGVDVMLCGPMPTPAIAYLTRALRLQAGVVISASHNPYEDNGIKFFSANGTKLPDAVEAQIESQLEQPMTTAKSAQLGKAKRIDDAAGRYIEFCKSTFPNALNLRGLKIVVDCANGATYHIAPNVFHELGADVIEIGTSPNGFNINDKVGATSPQALCDAVLAHHADIGIALDGDGDRLLMVDSNGIIYDGDQLLYIIARHQKTNGVAGTLMSNFGFERALGRMNIQFARAKVGDRYVMELMQERNWILGGENSGHIICLDRHTTGDGIIAALQVLQALREQNETLSDATKDLQMYPQKLINVRIPAEFDWQNDQKINTAVDAAKQTLKERGRILIRTSGTEPLLRVMVEGEDVEVVTKLAELIASACKCV